MPITRTEFEEVRVAVRLKLQAGYAPKAVEQNLIRNGFAAEQVAEALRLELEARRAGETREFTEVHTRRSLLDRLASGIDKVLIGLALIAIGVGLSVIVSVPFRGFAVVGFVGIIGLGMGIFLYGLSGGGDDD